VNKKEAIKILNEVIGPHRRTSKNELYFRCPACNHRKHKLAINLDKNAFHCWICDYRSRNIRRLVRRFGSYSQLQKWDGISDRADIERFADLFMEPVCEEVKTKIELPEEFVSLTNRQVPATGIYAYRYLQGRRISKDDILKWKIGFCFSGEYRNRIIVPSFDEDGDCNYFVARTYNGDNYKYKNPKASKDIIFNELFIDWNDDLILVEGIFDALVAGNAVPILGSTLRAGSKLLRKIVRNDTPVYVALDPDAAEKERRIIQMLLKYDIELYKIDVSGYEDVGAMPKNIFNQRKQQANYIDRDDYILRDMIESI
jgi:DNA primase